MKLTKQENKIMEMLSQGKSSKEIIEKLSIRYSTFRKHMHDIYEKYNLIDYDKDAKRVKAVLKFLRIS